MKKNSKNSIVLALAVMIFILLVINFYLIINTYLLFKGVEIVEEKEIVPLINISDNPISLVDYIKMAVSIKEDNILLISDCVNLSLETNEVQLHSLKEGIGNRINIRPTSHDVMRDILENFNISVLMVKVSGKFDDLYLANLYLREGSELLNIDIKPSDAIALAVRVDAPVYVKKNLLDEFGIKGC